MCYLTENKWPHFTARRISRIWRDLEKGNVRAYTGALRQVQSTLQKLQTQQKAFGNETEEIDKATQKFTLSWRSLGRLLAVQLAHQAISTLSNKLREATERSVELSVRIAEIRTIDVTNLGFEELSAQLLKVSGAFGLDVLDAAEAAYQALSNQVVKGAETFKFLDSAARLSKAGVTSISSSVQLLTAAINAFNIPVEQSEHVAGVFFKTVELGRLRIEELQNSFGRVAVPAGQLGISLEETAAALATATINGIKASEAQTLLRNVMLKLIRPTDEMKDLFKEWGVASGEAAIRAFGFQGVLAKIEERTKGSTTELGELFGRIRAITGAMVFAGEGLERFGENLEKIKDPAEAFERAVTLVLQNTGQKLRIEIEKIKNIFIKDFGQKLIAFAVNLNENFVRLTTITQVFVETLKVAIPIATTAAAIGILKLVVALGKLSKFNQILLGLTAILSLVTAIRNTFESAGEETERLFNSFIDQITLFSTKTAEFLKEQQQNIELTISRRVKDQLEATAIIIASYNRETEAFKKANERIIESIEDGNKDILKGLKEHLKDSEKEYQKYSRNVIKNEKKLRQIFLDLPSELFDLEIRNLTPSKKNDAILKRIEELKQKATEAATIGSDDVAESLLAELRALLQQRIQIVSQAEKELKVTENIVNLQKELRESREFEAKIRRQLLDEEEAAAARKKIAAAEEAAQIATISKLTEKVVGFDRKTILDATDVQGVTQAFTEIEETIRKLIDAREEAGIATAKNANLEKLSSDLRLDAESKIKQLKLEEARDELLAQEKIAKARLATILENRKGQQQLLDNFRINLRGVLSTISKEIPILKPSFGPDKNKPTILPSLFGNELADQLFILTKSRKTGVGFDPLIAETVSRLQQMLKDLQGGKFNELDIANRLGELRFFRKQVKEELLQDEGKDLIKRIDILLEQVGKIQELGGAKNLQLALVQSAKFLALSENKLAEISDQLRKNEDANLTAFGEFRKGASDFTDAVNKFEKAIAELRKLNEVGPLPAGQHGGFTHGPDNIPIIAQAGEFMMNRSSTQRFLPQLLSMNAGIQPMANGGQVTNVNGDFNISLASSGNQSVDVVSLGRALRNEIRRGRVTLN